MKKKGAALQVIGIILIVLQLYNYVRLDFGEVFPSDHNNLTLILGDVAFLIGYSLPGIIGIGLLLIYKKKNSQEEDKQDFKESPNVKLKEQTGDKELNWQNYKVNIAKPKEWQDFLDENFKNEGTKTSLRDLKKNDEELVCSNCGAVVSINETKCPHCGDEFEEDNTDSKKNKKSNINQKYEDLNKLKELLDKKIITKEEFEEEKKKILK